MKCARIHNIDSKYLVHIYLPLVRINLFKIIKSKNKSYRPLHAHVINANRTQQVPALIYHL